MKNANYNLLKLLHLKLDDVWRLDQFYLKDAEKIGCEKCKAILTEMKKDLDKHVDALKEELKKHMENDGLE